MSWSYILHCIATNATDLFDLPCHDNNLALWSRKVVHFDDHERAVSYFAKRETVTIRGSLGHLAALAAYNRLSFLWNVGTKRSWFRRR